MVVAAGIIRREVDPGKAVTGDTAHAEVETSRPISYVEAPIVYPVSCGLVDPSKSDVMTLGWGEIRSSNGHGAAPEGGLPATQAHIYEMELSGLGAGEYSSADFYLHVPTDRHEVAGERLIPPDKTDGVIVHIGLGEGEGVKVQYFSGAEDGTMRLGDFRVPRGEQERFAAQERATLIALRDQLEGRRGEFIEPLSVSYKLQQDQADKVLATIVAKLNGRIGDLSVELEALRLN